MGKKSKRPNRIKPKNAVASTTHVLATPAAPLARERVLLVTFDRLSDSQDWQGLLEIASKVMTVAKILENTHPSAVGRIYHNIGYAHKELDLAGGIEQAIVYFQKSIEMAKKAGNEKFQVGGSLGLAECYLKTDRTEKAMELHDSLCAKIGLDRIDRDYYCN